MTVGDIPNADAHQLVTYCAHLGLAAGHLIHASDQPSRESFDITGTVFKSTCTLMTSVERLARLRNGWGKYSI